MTTSGKPPCFRAMIEILQRSVGARNEIHQSCQCGVDRVGHRNDRHCIGDAADAGRRGRRSRHQGPGRLSCRMCAGTICLEYGRQDVAPPPPVELQGRSSSIPDIRRPSEGLPSRRAPALPARIRPQRLSQACRRTVAASGSTILTTATGLVATASSSARSCFAETGDCEAARRNTLRRSLSGTAAASGSLEQVSACPWPKNKGTI